MGISISHGVPSTRSALTISNLGQHLAHALSGSEWAEMRYLFDGSLSVPVSTPPAKAGRIASLLTKAAGHRAMDREWGQLATTLATSAQWAASVSETWEWT
jgi:hypothetical protein